MGKTIVRPDGSSFEVDDSVDSEKLQTLGYREETPGAEAERSMLAGQEEYYTTPGQQVKTALEGGMSGLSIGLSDFVFDSEDTKERAKYNPGVRLGGELVGGLLPMAPGAVGKALKYAPSGLLTRGAEAAGTAIGRGSKVIESLSRGAIEGGVIGGGAAVTTAQLNGDPITAESVMAGMGWGAIYGGGLSAMGAGTEQYFENKAERAATAEADRLAAPSQREIIAENELQRSLGNARSHAAVTDINKEAVAESAFWEDSYYGTVRDSMRDASAQMKATIKTAEEAMPDFSGMANDFGKSATKKLEGVGKMQSRINSQLLNDANVFAANKASIRGFEKEFSLAKAAAADGKYSEMVKHLEKFKEHMVTIEGRTAPFFNAEKVVGHTNEIINDFAAHKTELAGLQKYHADRAVAAAEELTNMTAIKGALGKMPDTAEQFVKMNGKTIEELSAAVDHLGKLRSAEVAGIKESVSIAVKRLGESAGVVIEGTPGQQLQGLWKIMKESSSARGREAVRLAQQGKKLWEKTSAAEDRLSAARSMRDSDRIKEVQSRSARAPWSMRYMAGHWAGKKLGPAGYVLGTSLVTGLVGLKSAVLGAVTDKINKWVPRAARGLQKVGPRIDPFVRRLDGTEDTSTRDRTLLMKARAREIAEAAPGVRDTLYRAVEPLSIAHPELAVALHKHGVDRFQFLLEKMPKDPGLAYSKLKSIWKPDAITQEKFARYYEVFQNPVAVANRALDTGRITLEAADGLKNMNPEIFSYLRAGMLYRIADPEVSDKLTYSDQVHLSMLLDLNLHSTLDPRFIAAQQQMFTERNQPLEMKPQTQPGGGAGRPPGPSATSAQRNTEH